LDRLAHMRWLDFRLAGEVGDGPRELEHSAVGPRGEAELGDGLAQKRLCRLGQPAVAADIPGCHMGVAVDPRLGPEALSLKVPRGFDSRANRRAGLARRSTHQQLARRDRRDRQVNVDAVE
jgi:hypothetical protein